MVEFASRCDLNCIKFLKMVGRELDLSCQRHQAGMLVFIEKPMGNLLEGRFDIRLVGPTDEFFRFLRIELDCRGHGMIVEQSIPFRQ